MANYMDRYDTGPSLEVPTIDTSQFSDLEMAGTLMQFKETKEQFWNNIGVGGSFTARALIHNNTIYIGNCDKNFYALTMDGKEKWRFPVNDVIAAHAVAGEGLIFFTSFDKSVYALTEEGQLKWKFMTNGKLLGSPAYSDGMVFVASTDANVYALKAATGRLLWKFQAQGSFVMPAVSEGRVFFGGNDNTLYCLNLEGKLIWKVPMRERVITWPAVIVGDIVIVGCWDFSVYGFDVKTGKQLWRFPTQNAPFPRVSLKGRLYFGGRDCNCYCIDVKTGKQFWKYPTNGFTGMFGTVSEDRAFYTSMDNNLYCLSLDGKLLWKFKTDGPTIAAAYHDDKMYLSSWDCHLYCLDAATGRVIWKFRSSIATPSQLAPPETGIVKTAQSTFIPTVTEQEDERYKTQTLGAGPESSYIIKSEYVVKSKYTSKRKIKSMSSGWE